MAGPGATALCIAMICYICNTTLVTALLADRTRQAGFNQEGEAPMTFLRWMASPPVAALITLGLFAMMAAMIRTPEIDWPEPQPYAEIDIRMEPEREPPVTTGPLQKLPPEAPPTTIAPPMRSGPPGPVQLPPTEPIDLPAGGEAFRFTKPVIKHPPRYPENCRSRQAQGVVRVQFDVTPEGAVVNPRVIETPHRCFVRAVLSAVSKWKYPPAGGTAMRYGLVETFSFVLSD